MNLFCRYLLRVTIARAYGGSMVQDVQLWVRNYEEPIEEVTPPIKARVRCLLPIGTRAHGKACMQ